MKKWLKVVVLFSLIWTIQSCESSNSMEEEAANCVVEWFNNQSDLIIDAGIAYGLEETEENCKAYREAIEEWIAAAEDCTTFPQEDIDQAYIDLGEIECN
ncbi:MAG: hypothetical protein P1U56_25445 [Saprospiraceae bacterium]|nr:hypothetical protein [Saprospiraceae bacterium]